MTPLQKSRSRRRIAPYPPTPATSADIPPKEEMPMASKIGLDISNPTGINNLQLKQL